MSHTVYLDHQALSPLLPEARAAMEPFLQCAETASTFAGSTAGLHSPGVRARDALALARAQLARLIGAANPDGVLFCSGSTEAANFAIQGSAFALEKRGHHIVASNVEHPAVLASLRWLERFNFTHTLVPCDSTGRVDPALVEKALRNDTVLIATHLVNPELGTVQRVREIAVLGRERRIQVYCDATAAVGWQPVDVVELGCSLLSFAAHRFGGPAGCGVLWQDSRARLEPLLRGGVQEQGLRAGMHNVAAIAGAGAAAELVSSTLSARRERAALLQKRCFEELPKKVERLHWNGPVPGQGRAVNHLSWGVEGVEAEALALALDLRGVQVGAGTSCATREHRISHVLKAARVPHAAALGTILLTLGPATSDEQMQRAVEQISLEAKRLRALSPMWEGQA